MSTLHKPARRSRGRRGVLTFEWILLLTLLVIGLVGGLSAVRNALLQEMGDLAQGVEALNASHSEEESPGHGSGSSSSNSSGERPWWETTGD